MVVVMVTCQQSQGQRYLIRRSSGAQSPEVEAGPNLKKKSFFSRFKKKKNSMVPNSASIKVQQSTAL